jgi:recombination endonuclease VII
MKRYAVPYIQYKVFDSKRCLVLTMPPLVATLIIGDRTQFDMEGATQNRLDQYDIPPLDNGQLLKVARRGWRADAAQHRYNLKKKYGLTPEAYQDLLQAQGGVCLICHQPPRKRRLAVDHDHKTKQVRGLLCSRCNYALGRFYERSDWLQRAADYLRQHGR